MKWQESPISTWVESKIQEFNFPNTAVLIGKGEQHQALLDYLNEFFVIWFLSASNPYAQDHKPFYFVRIITAEDGKKITNIFKEKEGFVYARFYRGKNFLKAFKKKTSI